MISSIQQLVPLVAERALNSIPAGLLIAAISWLLLHTVGKQDSRTRFAVWFSALLAVAALSFFPAPGAMNKAVRPEVTLPEFWAVAIFGGWTLIAIVASCRIAVGLWHLRRLRRSGVTISSYQMPDALQRAVQELGRTRDVAICESSLVHVPTAIGFFKPVILLPEWVLREVSADELRVILLHELAHLRRWDDWTNLVQKLVRTIFFFHPAVWWIEKRISLEREMACDDAVLAQTENPRAYAECLVSLAEKSVLRRGLAMAQAILGHARETSLRLARILDASQPKRTRLPALAVMAAVASVCIVLLPHSPTLIGFDNRAPSTNVTAGAAVVPPPVQALVVPVSLKTGSPQIAAVRAKATHASAPSQHKAPQQVLEVKHPQPKPSAPVLVQTSAPQTEQAPHFLLLMQTTQYENGSAVTNVYVWRLTFATRDRNTVQEEWIVKSL